MHFSTAFTIISLVASTVSAKQHCHRRHLSKSSSVSTSAAKQSANPVAAYKQDDSTDNSSNATWSSKGSSSSSWSSKTASAANSVSTSSGSSSSSSSSSGNYNYNLKGCQKNNIFVGFLPDDGEFLLSLFSLLSTFPISPTRLKPLLCP
jgi:DNA mismatch repair ATPase MutL